MSAQIYVNNVPHQVEDTEQSYESVVTLALGLVPAEPVSVSYRRSVGEPGQRKGTLGPGQTVTVRNGTLFIVGS